LQEIGIWLAVTAVILLIPAELLSPYYGPTNLLIKKKRLKNVSLGLSILFLTAVAMRIIQILSSS
jgi:hypothetical protein